MKAAPKILIGLLLSPVPSGCVGEELSGGDSLSSGGAEGTGSGPASGSGESDDAESATGVESCIAAADPNVVLAYQSMLTDLASTRDTLAARRLAAEQLIAGAFGVSTVADVRAIVSASTAVGVVAQPAAPSLCPGTLVPSEASAATCAPDVDVQATCLGLARRCLGLCGAPVRAELAEVGPVRCEGSCAGECGLEVSAACEGTCRGTCSGTCSCEAADGTCAGACNGMCEGICELAGGACSGECRGACLVNTPVQGGLGGDPDPVWCTECDGNIGDCDGAVDLEGLGVACHAIGQAAGLAHADCLAPFVLQLFELSSELDGDADARNEFKTALLSARPGFAELLAVIEHVDRFDDVAVPPLCSAPGQNAYNDLRDELGEIRSAARSALSP